MQCLTFTNVYWNLNIKKICAAHWGPLNRRAPCHGLTGILVNPALAKATSNPLMLAIGGTPSNTVCFWFTTVSTPKKTMMCFAMFLSAPLHDRQTDWHTLLRDHWSQTLRECYTHLTPRKLLSSLQMYLVCYFLPHLLFLVLYGLQLSFVKLVLLN